jgi:predicted RNase H-like HicB family nuclease
MDQPKYHIDIFWSEEDGGYIANVPDLRYCSAFGETYEEALREVLIAMELHLDTLREEGRPIPEPKSRRVVEVDASANDPNQVVDIQWITGEGNVSTVEDVGQAVGIQKSNVRLSRRFFENWIETLEEHAEHNRITMQTLNELVEEQREVFRKLSQHEYFKGIEENQPNATEAARRKAKELGVDLSQIEGTGSSGLITIKDVVEAAHR